MCVPIVLVRIFLILVSVVVADIDCLKQHTIGIGNPTVLILLMHAHGSVSDLRCFQQDLVCTSIVENAEDFPWSGHV